MNRWLLVLSLTLVSCLPPEGPQSHSPPESFPAVPSGHVAVTGVLTGPYQDYIPVLLSKVATQVSTGTVLSDGRFQVTAPEGTGTVLVGAYLDLDESGAFVPGANDFFVTAGASAAEAVADLQTASLSGYSITCVPVKVLTVQITFPAEWFPDGGALNLFVEPAVRDGQTRGTGRGNQMILAGATEKTIMIPLASNMTYHIEAAAVDVPASRLFTGVDLNASTSLSGGLQVQTSRAVSGTITLPSGYDQQDIHVAVSKMEGGGGTTAGSWSLTNATATTIDFSGTLKPGFYQVGVGLIPNGEQFEGNYAGWYGSDDLGLPQALLVVTDSDLSDLNVTVHPIPVAQVEFVLQKPDAPTPGTKMTYTVYPPLPGLDSQVKILSSATAASASFSVPAGYPMRQISLFWDANGDNEVYDGEDWVADPVLPLVSVAAGQTSSQGTAVFRLQD